MLPIGRQIIHGFGSSKERERKARGLDEQATEMVLAAGALTAIRRKTNSESGEGESAFPRSFIHIKQSKDSQ